MAWQLIYTSSARLLEAGRTGFGTVARHRAISALLTGKLESISQFAQLPGYDPARVIFSHRIMEVNARRFHVLSSIRSAGSDYSGRTNHIAHHLVVSEEEVRELCQRSVTPVDVLRAMEWRTSWDSAARFLEESDEVDLSQLTPNMIEVWRGVTGLADHARLPWSPQAAKGCIIVIPKHADACLFAGEALTHNPQQAWEISFTTHLEPNDGVSDFRWVFLYPDSVARGQAEQSARPLYDLTVPSFLPEPPAPVQAVATATPSPKRQAAPPPSFAPPSPSGMNPGSQWGMEKLVHTKVGQRIVAAGPSTAGGRTSQAESKKNRYKWALIAAACVMVAAIAGFGYQKHSQLKQERERLVGSVNGIWPNEFKPEGKDILIKEIKNANLDEIEQIKLNIKELKNLERYISLSLQSDTEPDAPIITNPEDPMFVDFLDIKKSVEKWLSFRKELREKLQNNPFDWNGLSEVLLKEDNAWKAIPEYPRKREQPQELLAEAKKTVIRTLEEQAVAVKDLEKADGVLKLLDLQSDVKAKAIMDCWKKLAHLKNEEVLQRAEYDRWKESSDLPKWLKAEVEKRKPQPVVAKAIQESLPAATKMAIQVPSAAIQDLEKSKQKVKTVQEQIKTYFVLLKENDSIESPELPIKKGMVLEVQSLDLQNLTKINLQGLNERSGEELLGSPTRMSLKTQSFIFSGKRLSGLPSEKEGFLIKDDAKIDCNKGFRMMIKSGASENIEIIVLRHVIPDQLLAKDQDRVGKVTLSKKGDHSLSLLPNLGNLKWPDKISVLYALRPIDKKDFISKDDIKIDMLDNEGAEFKISVYSKNNAAMNLAQKKKLEQELKVKTDRRNQANTEKSDYTTGANKIKKGKDEKIQELSNEVDALEKDMREITEKINNLEIEIKNPPPPPRPQAGKYYLVAKIEDRDFKICTVDLN